MATMIPPQKNIEYIFYVGLVSQADIKLLQNNPTLAAGDVLVSTDGGSTSNLDTLPAVTPASSDMVKVTVSTTEMNGDNIIIVFSDAAGSEWCDLIVNIQTAAQSLDTMDTNIDDVETDTATTIPGTITTLQSTADAITAAGPTKTEMDNAIATVIADTEDLQTQIGTDGAGLTDLGGMSTGMKAEVESEANDALIANNLDHLCKTVTASADMTTEVVDNTILSRMLASGDTSVFDPATDSLQDIRDKLTDIETDTAEIGTAGAGLSDLGGMSTGMKGEVEAECTDAIEADGLDHLVSASVTGTDITDNSIIAKMVSKDATADWDDFVNTTDALQAIRDKQTDIETDTNEIQGKLPTNYLMGSSVVTAKDDEIDAILVDTGTTLDDLITTVDTVVDAIKVKTDNLPWYPKKNVAFANFPFFMVLSSDHVTGATSKTVTVQISEDGGSFVTSTNSAAEIGSGFYKISFTQAEMNCDTFAWKFSASGCDTQAVTGATTE